MKKRFPKSIIYTLIAIVVMWGGWSIAYAAVQNDYILPSFSSAIGAMGGLFTSAFFWRAFLFSLIRTLSAFIISFVLALALSIFSKLVPAVRGILKPIVAAVRVMPAVAVILLVLEWTSPSVAPVVVAALVCLPMLYSAFLSAFDGVDSGLMQMCKAYKISIKDRIFKAYIPLALPYILDECGANLSLALKITVSAEVLAKTYISLGGMISEAKMYVEVSTLMALTIVTIIVGALIELAFFGIKKLVVRWRV